jgi:hypothetical protein
MSAVSLLRQPLMADHTEIGVVPCSSPRPHGCDQESHYADDNGHPRESHGEKYRQCARKMGADLAGVSGQPDSGTFSKYPTPLFP